MIRIAHTEQRTNAAPSAIFALWADIDNWANYDDGIEWAKLTDKFEAGGRYVIKPKGGPKTEADIIAVRSDESFIDISHLPGAKLRFDHEITHSNESTIVSITMTLSGPLSWVWSKILGKNQQADLEKSTAKLLVKAEGQR